MKKILVSILILGGLFLSSISVAEAVVSVKGYYRSNGTYVAPYVKSNPNGLKYDNYSYTPSQGLYNQTYGTRGTYWDTPTYLTDPDYYLGKSIYDSGNTSVYYPTTPSCPTNSYYDGISSCKCNYGYVSSGGSCVSGNSMCWAQTGYSSSYDSTTNSCKCDYGYVIGSSGQCVYKTTTKPTSYSGTSGYTAGTSNCPLNSHILITDSTKCQCDYGYQVDSTKTSCIQTVYIPSYTPSYTPPPQNNEEIGKNYYIKNKTCVGLSGDSFGACMGYAVNH
jgi:hypothetical protein